MSDSALEESNITACVDADASREDRLIHRIGMIPVIVEEIFHHLPIQDLYNCAKVCKMWNRISRRAKKSRHQFSWIFWTGQYRKSLFANHISSVLQHTFSRPRTAILFAANAFFDVQEGFEIFISSSNVSDSPLVDSLLAELPHDCQVLGAGAVRVIGTDVSSTITRDAFTCLLLPDMPGVDIYSFLIDDSDLFDLREEEIPRLTGIPVHAKVRCMIFFGYAFTATLGSNLVRSIIKNQSFQFPFGGGNGRMLVAPRFTIDENREPDNIGIAFCGENIEAASVCFDANVRDEDYIRSVLMQLKSVPEDRSFAFIFSNTFSKDSVDVHVGVFRKLFPKTLIFGGVFEWCGVGFKRFVSSKDSPDESFMARADGDCFIIASTLIILISISQ